MRGRNQGAHNQGRNSVWTPERESRLKELWDSDAPASKIASILGGGLTRNAVIGKARRMGCIPRESPIKPRDSGESARSIASRLFKKRARSKQFLQVTTDLEDADDVPEVIAAPLRLKRSQTSLGPSCAWPIGHPDEKGFRFCVKTALIGLPYCEAHHIKAHAVRT